MGVTPDVETVPILIDDDEVDLFQNGEVAKGKLHQHLVRDTSHAIKEKPHHRLLYLRDLELEEKMSKDFERLQADFEVKMAAGILLASSEQNRELILEQAERFIAKTSERAEEGIIQSLQKRGIDWSMPKESGLGASAQVDITTNLTDGRIKAGEKLEVTVTVRNMGNAPFIRLSATTESADPQVDDREFVLAASILVHLSLGRLGLISTLRLVQETKAAQDFISSTPMANRRVPKSCVIV